MYKPSSVTNTDNASSCFRMPTAFQVLYCHLLLDPMVATGEKPSLFGG